MTTMQVTSGEGSRRADGQTMESEVNTATVLRYPFQHLELGWLMEYIETCLPEEERRPAATRLLNDFMAFAVLHGDPFLEKASCEFYKYVNKGSENRPRLSKDLSSQWGVVYAIFEAIQKASKYPQSDMNVRAHILEHIEKTMKDVGIVVSTQPRSGTSKAAEVITSVAAHVQRMRGAPESQEIYSSMMRLLRMLFFCFSPCIGVYSIFQDAISNGKGTFVCCEGCPCYNKLRNAYTLFIRDVEKMKVVDCLLMMAVKEEDAIACRLMRDLFTRLDYRNPFLDKPVRRIQNGSLFAARVTLFDALHNVKELLSDTRASPSRLTPHVESILLALYVVRREIKSIRDSSEQIEIVDQAIAAADAVYVRLGTDKVVQHLRTLKDHIFTIFAFLSDPEFHLAVHSRDLSNPRGQGGTKCCNPACPGNARETLKCSGCRMTSYCGVACQRADYKSHRPLCTEMGRRKATPNVVKVVETEIRVLKPIGLS
nr:conserved hypothetical protein [Trypanosoma congolense IL3000]